MAPRISDPSVWNGDELLQRADWLVQLTAADVDELSQAINATESIPIDEINGANFPLSLLAERLASVQESLEYGSGAALIRGFPLQSFTEEQATRAFYAVATHIGTPISQSASGERIFHIRDAGFKKDDPRARGPNTNKKLSFHTDRCDVIGFMCLKQAKSGGENFLVSSTAVYNAIANSRPELLHELRQPFYYKRHTVDLGNESPYCQQPIFSFTEGRFACSFLRVLIDRAYLAYIPEPTSGLLLLLALVMISLRRFLRID